MDIGKRLPALQSRDYRLWFFGQGVSVIGTWLQNTGQAWLVLRLTNSPFKLGLITSVQFLPSLLFSVFVGPLVDLFPKRSILLCTQSLFALSAACLAWISFSGDVRYWQVLLVAALTGFVSMVDFPARQSFVSEQVKDSTAVPNALALNAAVFNVARVLGPALGGLAIAVVGIPWTFTLNAVSYLAVIAGLALMRAGRRPSAPPSGDFLGEIRRGWAYILGDKVIVTLLAQSGAISLFVFNFNILIPSLAAIALGLGSGGYGGLMACLGAGALTAAVSLSLRGSGLEPTPRLIYGACILLCLAMIAAGLQRSAFWAGAALVACGFGMTSFNTLNNSAVQMQARKDMRGRVMSAYNLVFVGSTPIGSLYAGRVSDSLGPSAGFWISGLVGLTFTACMLLFVAPRTLRGIRSFARKGPSEAASPKPSPCGPGAPADGRG